MHVRNAELAGAWSFPDAAQKGASRNSCADQEDSGGLAVANQLHVEPTIGHRFQRPPHRGVYPIVVVAKGAAAELSK